jgi:hypothetical protein
VVCGRPRAQGIKQGVFVATIGTNYNLVITHKAAYVLGTSAAFNSRLPALLISSASNADPLIGPVPPFRCAVSSQVLGAELFTPVPGISGLDPGFMGQQSFHCVPFSSSLPHPLLT